MIKIFNRLWQPILIGFLLMHILKAVPLSFLLQAFGLLLALAFTLTVLLFFAGVLSIEIANCFPRK